MRFIRVIKRIKLQIKIKTRDFFLIISAINKNYFYKKLLFDNTYLKKRISLRLLKQLSIYRLVFTSYSRYNLIFLNEYFFIIIPINILLNSSLNGERNSFEINLF